MHHQEYREHADQEVARSNNCPFPSGASLNTGFPTPFLRSLMLRTCKRILSAGTMKVPVSSPSGKTSRYFVDKTFQRGANRLPISRSSRDFDWRTVMCWFCHCKVDHQLRRRFHFPCIEPVSRSISHWFRIRVWRVGWYVGIIPDAIDPHGNACMVLFTRKL